MCKLLYTLSLSCCSVYIWSTHKNRKCWSAANTAIKHFLAHLVLSLPFHQIQIYTISVYTQNSTEQSHSNKCFKTQIFNRDRRRGDRRERRGGGGNARGKEKWKMKDEEETCWKSVDGTQQHFYFNNGVNSVMTLLALNTSTACYNC